MSIRADVTELQSIQAEINSLNKRRRILREKEKEVQARIKMFLEAKNQPGLKHQGTAIKLEEKETRISKKNKDRDSDACSVLEKYGISNPDKVLAELLEARRGEKVLEKKLKLGKYKEKR